ncbi:MAG: adenine phosphoribosyltransferase [Candidatus Muiribacteriota bacterium]|jgi:adenine phosphoribosyltransferase
MDLKKIIRDVPDFPKPGIIFKDITPVLKNIEAFNYAIKKMAEPFEKMDIDYVVGAESRGFIFGTLIASHLNAGFIPVRKPGKLPYKTISESYELEYGTDSLEIHEDAVEKGKNVLIVDDLLATGGTAEAMIKLIEKTGGIVKGMSFLIELDFLKGRERFAEYNVNSHIIY